ncbi:hypothetical protein DACRYDRAFT_107023 [Dacryopinax primogenitus]|uniref:Uncharacterized protein n=1 Tax=Dacryopinax primogenitus (strain DJM 731) TaxID=1858805 RepID=M5FW31_DACPD|nr:uncharacterized protein DACRYDRAFT_107023 [Dacryopinax primogenitus]EJU02076.1 hypothetical protein DACRYDRAFT_107023 [Dacryopinax primogenitus]
MDLGGVLELEHRVWQIVPLVEGERCGKKSVNGESSGEWNGIGGLASVVKVIDGVDIDVATEQNLLQIRALRDNVKALVKLSQFAWSIYHTSS